MSTANDKPYEDFTHIPGVIQLKERKSNTKPFNCDVQASKANLLPDESSKHRVTSFRTLLSNFAASTTAHGVGRMATASSVPRLILWCVMSLAFYVALAWMCAALVLRYMDKPVVSRIEISFEEALNFPAVTICNLNMLNRKKLQNRPLLSQILGTLEARRYNNTTPQAFSLTRQDNSSVHLNISAPDIDHQIQSMESFNRKSLLAAAKTDKARKLLQDVGVDRSNMETKYLDMIVKSVPDAQLAQVGHNLDEMLKRCRWTSFTCDSGSLRKLWTHFWHWKYGNCYVFNSGLSQDGSSLPILQAQKAGPYNGLEIDLFINQNQYTAITEEAGIRVVLSDQARMPFPFDEGFSVPTGFSTTVGITKKCVKRVDPYRNNSCFDENRTKESHNIYREKYHVNYSSQACRMSCLAATQVTQCNCSDPRFPNNSSACFSEQQQECVGDVNRKFAASELDCIKKCPQPCHEHSFSYTVSSSQWSNSFKTMIKHKYGDKKTFTGTNSLLASQNFLRLQVFYQDLSVTKMINEEAYEVENLLADIGLWIGVSVMTGVELLEFIIDVVSYLWEKCSNKSTK